MPFTPYPDVNQFLAELLPRVQGALGEQLAGFYLDGSLANGGFDAASDIDFVAAVRGEIDGRTFGTLRAMHDELARVDSPWALQLEGTYMSLESLRQFDPARRLWPNLERGLGERLKWADHGESWDVHRWILREHGIVLYGPPPAELIDPVTPEQLRTGLRADVFPWLAGFLDDPTLLQRQRGYQSYIVLTVCRTMYTLETGGVVPKAEAMHWVLERVEPRWQGLIRRAWTNRSTMEDMPAEEIEVAETIALIQLLIERENKESYRL